MIRDIKVLTKIQIQINALIEKAKRKFLRLWSQVELELKEPHVDMELTLKLDVITMPNFTL